ITPNEPVLSTEEPDNSLSIGDEHLDTVPATKSDEFIKSSVENLIPIPRGIDDDILLTIKDDTLRENLLNVNHLFAKIEALNDNPTPFYDPIVFGTPLTLTSFGESDFFLEETNTFDNSLPESDTLCFDVEEISSGGTTTHSDISLLEYEASYDDQLFSDEDVSEKIFSKPLFDEEIIPMKMDQHPDNDEFDLMESLRTHDSSLIISSKINSLFDEDILILKDLPSNDTLSIPEIESFHFDIPSFSWPPAKPPDGNTGILNIKMMGDISDQKAFMHKLMITLASHQEKSPDLLSHRGLKAFQPSATCPMMIHGKNNPILDVLLFHFYPS
nr:hypothetical protein [Tanacetum cinerariifolium]